MVNEYVTILKLTSLASIIAVTEVVHSANTLVSNSYRPLEVYTALAVVYVILVVPLSLAAKKLEGKKTGKRTEKTEKSGDKVLGNGSPA